MWEKLLSRLGLPLARLIWSQVSDELRDVVKESILDLEARAAATANKWDDWLVSVLKEIIRAVAGEL